MEKAEESLSDRCGSQTDVPPTENSYAPDNVDDVVFPCGYTMDPDGDTITVYYGAADCSIALARTSVQALLAWLDTNGSCEHRQRTEI